MNCAKDLLLYAVTDRYWLGNHTLTQDVEAALKGGATMIQLREKTLCDADFLAEAKVIKALCAQYNVPFIINDNVAIARACDADGIHVGQRDMEADDVRALIGSTKLLGVSAQTVEQALLAQSMGADYLGVGAVYTTGTKADADNVSMDTLTDICAAVDIPVVAIGGITQENLSGLSGTGIAGIAVVSAIFAAEDIKGATQALLTITREMIHDC
ncbi:MAG: thiamine phosphate synthase [Eubacterium aggregans]|uniref:Thiamine-phosphate synthase n=1 Tax=Eubacterium aggregans TaxID=81409 RepID=A0A1H4BFS2_9FIRM|nr:thiamine phosphate synthase [Eubacterium aggregans]MEA5073056.1 thiamine phosphate synthase [Eubacterium aggregans]SEA46652.1 thiamine-phosphate diphosphorylase [Eubacterium aggregans]